WRQMPQGQVLPFDPGGGKHECDTTIWRLEDYYDSLLPHTSTGGGTRKTKCWWCGEEVFYHSNGFGDSVLFDELGWPWVIHPCWESYRSGRRPTRPRHDSIEQGLDDDD